MNSATDPRQAHVDYVNSLPIAPESASPMPTPEEAMSWPELSLLWVVAAVTAVLVIGISHTDWPQLVAAMTLKF